MHGGCELECAHAEVVESNLLSLEAFEGARLGRGLSEKSKLWVLSLRRFHEHADAASSSSLKLLGDFNAAAPLRSPRTG
jgi:hypothetical protein